MRITDLVPWSGKGSRNGSGRREGSNSLMALQSDMNRVFEDFWSAFGPPALGLSERESLPRVDVRESDKEVEVVAELPGMDEADIDVSLAEGVLTIRGEKKAEQEKEEKGYVLRERRFGLVERTVPLPDGLDVDAAQAKFKNGVLTVAIPKTAQARSDVKRIAVKRA
jgi:HSP20 family protein